MQKSSKRVIPTPITAIALSGAAQNAKLGYSSRCPSVNSDGSIRIHRLVQEVMRQRTHVNNTYESTKLTTYEMLKHAFSEQKDAMHDTIFEDALWCLHYDPSPVAALELSYENPPHYDVEANFQKTADGVRLVFRVMDSSSGRPMHTIERRYYLDGGWKSELLRNWQS
jgi:hypothetical protein